MPHRTSHVLTRRVATKHPHYLMFGRRPRLPVDFYFPSAEHQQSRYSHEYVAQCLPPPLGSVPFPPSLTCSRFSPSAQALEDSKSGYLVGDALTLADLALFEPLLQVEDYMGAQHLDPYPALKVRQNSRLPNVLRIGVVFGGGHRKSAWLRKENAIQWGGEFVY